MKTTFDKCQHIVTKPLIAIERTNGVVGVNLRIQSEMNERDRRNGYFATILDDLVVDE